MNGGDRAVAAVERVAAGMAHSNNIATSQRGADCQSAVLLAGWQPAPRCSFFGTGHIRRPNEDFTKTSRFLQFVELGSYE
jgi:hypothetical protein